MKRLIDRTGFGWRHQVNSIKLFILIQTLCFVGVPVFGDWPSFRGNPQLTGVATTELPDELTLLWTFQAEDIIESTAAVVDGTVYFGALDGYLYAVDAQNGQLKWKFQAEGQIKASPSIRNGNLYFGDGTGVFYAIDIGNGQVNWQFHTEGEIISSANFSGERVLFGSYDGFLYCLNRRDGTLVWKFETEGYVHGTPCDCR